ncbi:Uncharacterized protein TCAP_00557 [Tolypocladium capitatum]|uniref:Uncharacterized protein n=1 Tax=Tolypocladium capitatum TaxID=45235 RepID=A0A2K3QPQ7_9HYPO|nr:Uncharacterized protein TCAP_00557 [Tolypocladium capitatum]
MASADGPLSGHSISPLTPTLRHGLLAITVLAFVSFVCSTTLFLYLTYKLLVWHFAIRRRNARRRSSSEQSQRPPTAAQQTSDFTLGIDGIFTGRSLARAASATSENDHDQHKPDVVPPPRDEPPRPNQFLVLIYNLLLADMHQGLAFLLNSTWLRLDGIFARTPTCFAQGFFMSTGDLSSSIFITTIAVHTFLSIVQRRRPPQRLLYLIVVANWIFVYLLVALPIAATHNGANVGGFYVRAGVWCWMNRRYEHLRLATHYLFIYIALGTTSALYVSIFIWLRRQQSRTRKAAGAEPPGLHSRNVAFLIYPIIYVACTLPLALCRVAIMGGRDVRGTYFLFAGAMVSLNGAFDCLLFGTTRNVIIFGSTSNLGDDDTGIDTFTFLQTPSTRQFGNMVWIQGGDKRTHKRRDETAGGWWSWKRLRGPRDKWPGEARPRNASQESLRSRAIQMDLVTSVVVEVDDNHHLRYPSLAGSAAASMKSVRIANRDLPGG